MEEAVYYKSENDTIYVRATGHVTALACPLLKAAVFDRLDAAPPVERVFLDLSLCEYMDSTFLGLIVGTQKRFARIFGDKAPGGGSIVLVGVNDACKGLLRTIGVLGMVKLSNEEVPFPSDLERIAGGTHATARFILDAHEDLSALSAENRKRFAAITKLLKSAIDSGEGEEE